MSSTEQWEPPALTEKERTAIQAKQKERELLSNSMGQYLLKGYRMLGTNCGKCGNILLKAPKEDADFCIFCQELKPGEPAKGAAPTSTPSLTTTLPQTHHKKSAMKVAEASQSSVSTSQTELWSQTEETLMLKVKWATNELSQTSSVEYSTQLCVLIREAIDTVGKLRNL